MDNLSIPSINLLEPPAFAGLFMEFPPMSFACRRSKANLPLFFTNFDLLTTLEEETRGKLGKIPFFRHWSGLLRFSTCFCGTTITEYAPLPASLSARELLEGIRREHGRDRSLIIIKDLPVASPLLPPEDSAYAQALAEEGTRQGFIEVQGQALAYVPVDFADEEAYLARLSASRRKNMRRKLKKKDSLSIDRLPLGSELFFDPVFLETAYAMYLEVFRQSDIHFDLLSPEFFAALLQSRSIEGVVFLYRHEGTLAGYNICLVHGSVLIDKYIGLTYPLARELNLYFISWMVNLAYAKEKGFSFYVAGWTDPEVKASLGARFTFTRHLVWVKNSVLRRILYRLRHLFESDSRVVKNA